MSFNDTLLFPIDIFHFLPSGVGVWLRSGLQVLFTIFIEFCYMSSYLNSYVTPHSVLLQNFYEHQDYVCSVD